MDAMEFFRQSAGQWRSQRTTHHLAFRRAENGDSSIFVEALEKTDPRVVEICTMHAVDPATAIGGAYVSWQGSMDWDREAEGHSGTTVFALVPDDASGRSGQLLRERGYAEIVPVIGRFDLDDNNNLNLITDYETMSAVEQFWFMGPNLRLRASTVTRFGGLSTAAFCAEIRQTEAVAADEPLHVDQLYSSLGW
ncbi:phycobiliprotein lyase [Synechococcus elongatus]|uniref:Chromophore lyase CpcS/CpeS n=1 Tax=Synechococcus elongatus PCC 11801 TaxID=2219813 RepID=A0AAN1QN15_SYNEL|nr:phycobiliprotein lyase [Synechococcus elongatus]AZB72363.1 phycobiliprotein lyase [Synechococcus elongatus PCC 11801]